MQQILNQLSHSHSNLRRRYPEKIAQVNTGFQTLERIYHDLTEWTRFSLSKGWDNAFHRETLLHGVQMYLRQAVRFEGTVIRSVTPERVLLLSEEEMKVIKNLEDFFSTMAYLSVANDGRTRDMVTYVGSRSSLVCYYHPSRMIAVNWQSILPDDSAALRLREIITRS